MATLEFLVTPLAALQEMVRCVRKQGFILIGSLNRIASFNRLRLLEGREPYISGHLYSPDELYALLQSFGQVRMVASNPDETLSTESHDTWRYHSNRNRIDGPFIIAEVRI